MSGKQRQLREASGVYFATIGENRTPRLDLESNFPLLELATRREPVGIRDPQRVRRECAAMGYLLRFGVFELNLVTEELRKFGTPIKIAPQPFKVLALLASQAGQIVTREQIQLQLWGEETYVDFEQGLNHCIKQIRYALNDSPETPRYIETLPRRGYRFVAPVEVQVLPWDKQDLNVRLVDSKEPPLGHASEAQARGETPNGYSSPARLAASIPEPATATAVDSRGASVSVETISPAVPLRRNFTRTAVVAALILLVVIGFGYLLLRSFRVQVSNRRQTMVVLPFESIEQDASSSALARGLSESITGKLAQNQGQGKLELISAREARDMGVKTADDARRKLQTDYVLEGSVQHLGDRVQVSCSLVDPRSHRQLGARTVTGNAADLFSLEDQVVGEVLEILPGAPRLTGPKTTQAGTQPPGYDAYLRGVGYLLEYEKPENVDSAITDFNHALAMDRSFAPAHAGLGRAYWIGYESYNKGNEWLNKASEECNQALQLNTNLAEAHTCMGLFYNTTGKYEQAVVEFRRAADLDSNDDLAWRGLGGALEHLKKPAEAEAAYKKAISLRPQYWAPYNWLGRFYFGHARYSEASEMFRKAIELAPENQRLYSNLAAIYVQIGRYDDAIVALRRSIDLRPTMSAYSNLGAAYFYTHKYAEAGDAFRKAAELDSKDWLNWGNLADALYWTPGRRPEAAQAYETARKLAAAKLNVNPSDGLTTAYVADYSAMLEEKTKAFADIDRALKLSPNDGDVLFRAAVVYNHFGDDNKTLGLLQSAVQHGFSATTIRDTPDFDHLNNNQVFAALAAKK
jgi:tetratricopeptide (TPR) repeat protein/DNA-binding winged helix-turn-helix (wHTH) protein/TolB-like protein